MSSMDSREPRGGMDGGHRGFVVARPTPRLQHLQKYKRGSIWFRWMLRVNRKK